VEAAHKVKGAGTGLGVERVEEAAHKLEELAKEGRAGTR